MRRFLLILSMFSVSATSFAQTITLSSFQSTKDHPVVVSYISGVGAGYVYANALLMSEGNPLIFCQPMGLALIGKNYIQLIESEAKRPSVAKPYPGDTVVEVVLLNALRANFPCRK